MANKEKIDYLLLDIRELETLVAGMRDAEVYPVSFFGQTFDLTHKILKDLHALETAQIEMLRKQMEEHQALIQSIPPSVATPVQTVQEASITAPAPIPAEPEPVIQEQEIRQELPAEQGLSAGPEPIPVEEPETPAVETSGKVIPAERPGLFLNDLLEKKNFSDFRKAFSLNAVSYTHLDVYKRQIHRTPNTTHWVVTSWCTSSTALVSSKGEPA